MSQLVSLQGSQRQRRQWLLAASSTLLLPGLFAAGLPALPGSESLSDELRDALRSAKPLVVMVSLEGCVFCRSVRERHLVPLREQEGISVVQVDMRSRRLTRDFSGGQITHDDRVRAWNVKVAPTVLFIGRGGAEFAERLSGFSEDFYGSYLAERLARAQARLRA